MSSQISSTAATARENARASDGRFGEQEHTRANGVDLGQSVRGGFDPDAPIQPVPEAEARMEGARARWARLMDEDQIAELHDQMSDLNDAGDLTWDRMMSLADERNVPPSLVFDVAGAMPDALMIPRNGWPHRPSQESVETLTMLEQTGFRYTYATERDGNLFVVDQSTEYLADRDGDGTLAVTRVADPVHGPQGPRHRLATLGEGRKFAEQTAIAADDYDTAIELGAALNLDNTSNDQIRYHYDRRGGKFEVDLDGDTIVVDTVMGPEHPNIHKLAAHSEGLSGTPREQAVQAVRAIQYLGRRAENLDRTEPIRWPNRSGELRNKAEMDRTRDRILDDAPEGAGSVMVRTSGFPDKSRTTVTRYINDNRYDVMVGPPGRERIFVNGVQPDNGQLEEMLRKRHGAAKFIGWARGHHQDMSDLAEASWNGIR